MADGTQIDVDIVLGDTTLNASLARTAQTIRDVVQAARGLQDQFAGTVRSVDPLLTSVTSLRRELAATRDQGGLQSGLREQLRTAEADLRTATAALTAARAAASAPAPGSGQGGAGGVPPLTPGGSPGGGAVAKPAACSRSRRRSRRTTPPLAPGSRCCAPG